MPVIYMVTVFMLRRIPVASLDTGTVTGALIARAGRATSHCDGEDQLSIALRAEGWCDVDTREAVSAVKAVLVALPTAPVRRKSARKVRRCGGVQTEPALTPDEESACQELSEFARQVLGGTTR